MKRTRLEVTDGSGVFTAASETVLECDSELHVSQQIGSALLAHAVVLDWSCGGGALQQLE